MSESAKAQPANRYAFSSFARTLLALCVITRRCSAACCPRTGRTSCGTATPAVTSPSRAPRCWCARRSATACRFTANYYEDMISSASIDVKLSASPYQETRKQGSGGVEYLHGKSTYSAGYIHSTEPDYKANTTYFSVSQDMFGDLTTLTLGYRRGWDQIFRDIKDADGHDHQRPDLPRARRSPRLLAVLEPDPDAQHDRELQLRAPDRPGLPCQPVPQDPLSRPRDRATATRWPTRCTRRPAPAMPPRSAEVLPAWRAAVDRRIPLLPRYLGHRWQHLPDRLHPAAGGSWIFDASVRYYKQNQPTSTATCSRARTTRTSWPATASWPPSTATPSARRLLPVSAFSWAPWISKSTRQLPATST